MIKKQLEAAIYCWANGDSYLLKDFAKENPNILSKSIGRDDIKELFLPLAVDIVAKYKKILLSNLLNDGVMTEDEIKTKLNKRPSY